MIESHELTKRHGGTTAVNTLTFTVRPGHVTGFLGPNGSGKSTTLRNSRQAMMRAHQSATPALTAQM